MTLSLLPGPHSTVQTLTQSALYLSVGSSFNLFLHNNGLKAVDRVRIYITAFQIAQNINVRGRGMFGVGIRTI